MEAELWSSPEERDEVSEAGRREQWHFQNALFEDIRNTTTTSSKPSKSNMNNSMSRRRYSCLACGEIKRWDQLTQHYKKFVQFDSLGIPCVPDQKQMSDKVYQHTAIFFEKNFSRDRMPMYKDHVSADSLHSGGEERQPAGSRDLYLELGSSKPSEELVPFSGQHSLFFSSSFPLKMPPLKLPPAPSPARRGSRKRKLAAGSVSSSSITSSSGLTSCLSTNSSPSQSRRFYKCLGCGAAKRWDRLTDHYRKYVVFGPLGQPVVPSIETMTPEQYVHSTAFREQGFSADRMPQYKDHIEANQDNEEEFSFTDEPGRLSRIRTESEPDKDLVSVNFQSSDRFTRNEGTQSSLSSPKQPNMEDFWEKKTFSDCQIICQGGRIIETHRLILAAHNDFFYQLLVNSKDEDTSVIMMPDHSFEEISAIVQQLYNFKVRETAFIFNEQQNELKTSENPLTTTKLYKKSCRKLGLDTITAHSSAKRKKPEENYSEDNFESESNSDLSSEDFSTNLSVERFIRKTGGGVTPTYSCKVGTCQFSVKKSLMCIKGHILAEHWASLLCSSNKA